MLELTFDSVSTASNMGTWQWKLLWKNVAISAQSEVTLLRKIRKYIRLIRGSRNKGS